MASPPRIRQLNRHFVLERLLSIGTATRSDLARATGLSQPTTGKIVDEFIAEGVLQNVDLATASANRMGRPGLDVALSDSSPCFLAVQLGVVHTRIARLPVAPPPSDRWEQTLLTPRSLRAWASALRGATKGTLEPSIRAAIVSVPGVVNDATGESILSPNIDWLEGQNILHVVRDALELPVFAVQEIRCLALGHSTIDRTADSFLLVDFGTGIGSAAVLDGRLMQGRLPMGGELGHTPVVGNTLPCGCGGTGCLETLVGRDALLRTLGIETADWYPTWIEAARSLTPRTLPRRFREALEAAATGIAGALNVLGLDRVIVTGFLGDLPEPVIGLLGERIEAAAIAGRFGQVKTTVAPRRRLAGLARVGIDHVIAPL